jgi:hypothetical protein
MRAIASSECAGVIVAMNLFFRPLSSISAVLCLVVSFCCSTSVWAASPRISGTPATAVTVGNTYVFTPRAYDADGQRLTFRIANKPAWATFSTSTGRLSGTPGGGYIGTYNNIVISVSDGNTRAYLPSFSITVRANRPPTISGTPATSAIVGTLYAFAPRGYDPDGQTLTFRISNKPAWANFNTATGRLSGTPGSGYIGTYSNIVISVSDGRASASLASFSITVRANRAPTISGTPATAVAVGSTYAFTPRGYDPDGQTLTYRISNKPVWASFNTATGRLSGTPTSSHVGRYYNIVISVSDGARSASLPAFAISVNAVTAGTVTLSWAVPTQNVDGTRLTNLAGYRVFYGTVSRQYSHSVSVPNPAITSVVLEGLATGRTWYFSLKAVNSNGVTSNYSAEASRAIP